MRKYLLLLLYSFLFFACTPSADKSAAESDVSILQKRHFSIIKKNNYTIIEVKSPFVDSKFTERYVLYPKNSTQPEIENVTHFITLPIQRVGINSTTHLGFIEALQEEDKIIAATNLNLFYSKKFNENIKEGKVASIGNRSLNHEALIASNCDVYFSYAIDASTMKEVEKLRGFGIKVVLIAEFMENDPLNKASWLSVFATFLEKEKQAKELLTFVKDEYSKYVILANSSNQQPSVMVGYPWKGTWYVSGGDSFQANYFKSANSNYIWKNQEQKEGGIPLTFERVLMDAINADYWLNPGGASSLLSMLKTDQRFSSFASFKEKTIFSNFKRTNKTGANDYWETAVVRADLVLKDLVSIFHKELLPDHELFYYKNLTME